jgi:hypothetical protein
MIVLRLFSSGRKDLGSARLLLRCTQAGNQGDLALINDWSGAGFLPLYLRAKRGRFSYRPLLFPLEQAVAGHFFWHR